MNVHSHTPSLEAIYNLTLDELHQRPPYPVEEQWLSAGLHPWKVTAHWEVHFEQVCRWAVSPQVKAIGECGLDHLVHSPFQMEAFRAHVRLAEEVGKPLIIHCVKAVDELLAVKKEMKPIQPWIFHGFRGNQQQAEQLLKAGFYLSFGEHFQVGAVKACLPGRLCLETDESALSIQEIRQRILTACEIGEESFAKDLFLK